MRKSKNRNKPAKAQVATFKLRLYVAGDAPNSVQARSNLAAFCRKHLPGRHDVEIIDVFREPARALADGILLTPMLVKLSPSPIRRVLGSLSQSQPVLRALGLSGSSE